jgi:hypothetical protein
MNPSNSSSHAVWPAMRRGAGLLVFSILVLGLALSLLIRSPQMPYNVVQMFGGAPSLAQVTSFALALLSLGMGAHFAAYFAARHRLKELILPLWCILFVLTTYALAQIALTDESFDDFVGSPVLYRDITRDRVWGDTMALVLAHVDGTLFAGLERVVRFVFLVAPLVMWLAIFRASCWRRQPVRAFLAYALMAAPWLGLFTYVAFYRPNTNNLVELIEPGGGVFLYCLMLCVAFSVAWMASLPELSRRGKLTVIVVFVSAIPIGWLLLNLGMIDNLQKYGITFSGIDFLLGPDRGHKLAGSVLFLRWTVLQATTMLGLAWSVWLATHFVPPITRD